MKRTKILVIIPTIDKKKKAKESYFNEKKWQEVVKSAATENIVLEKSIFGNASKSLLLNETSFSSLLNIGFTGAVNSTLLAAYQEDYDWFFVLNDDAVLRADFFEKLNSSIVLPLRHFFDFENHVRMTFVFMFLVLLLKIPLLWFFIPQYGLLGVAFTQLIAVMFHLVLCIGGLGWYFARSKSKD